MKIKFILPALTEAHGNYWRPIKYSLFPPLGLATLAGYLNSDDEASIVDEHVERIDMNDTPDIVALEVYITSARRAYEIADHYRSKGVYVILGGLHVTSLPYEASRHADTIVTGPAEEAWPRFLGDYRKGNPAKHYRSRTRSLDELPMPRRDLICRQNYLVPNSIVISRGCPHACDFCYKDSFFSGGKSFYTLKLDRAIEEITNLPGKHLFFLDDNLFGRPAFSQALFREMAGLNRIWQAAATVQAVQNRSLVEDAARAGLRSLFIGFESLNEQALHIQNKQHNRINQYESTIRLLHDLGIMVNASFVFGLDGDDQSVFDSTVEWAIRNGIETCTFHLLTPYPGTALFERYQKTGRIRTYDWNLYDTRHSVASHPAMTTETLEHGYWNAYKRFYSWSSILRSVMHHKRWQDSIRHLTYCGAWKKMEWFWGAVIHMKKLNLATPALESVLGKDLKRSGTLPANEPDHINNVA